MRKFLIAFEQTEHGSEASVQDRRHSVMSLLPSHTNQRWLTWDGPVATDATNQ
jgi:hypothetical protein